MIINIIFISFLLIIFIYISPIIDHLMPEYDENKSSIELLIEIIIQLFLIGIVVYLIRTNKKLSLNFLKISKYEELIIDLIATIVFIGTQRQLSFKLKHLTNYHHIQYLIKK